MRTVTFRSVLWGIAYRLSLDPGKNLPADVARALTEYVNTRVRKAWNLFAWPAWTWTEERRYRADYDAATAYAEGEEVYYPTDGNYYRATQATTGNAPTNATYWEEATDLDRYVALDQDWQAHEIGEVLGVYADDPRTTSRPRPVEWWESPNGIQVSDEAGDSVWIEFREPAPVFTTTAWATATDYDLGDLVYLSATGECYKAIAEGSGNNPAESPLEWARVKLPACLAEYVKGAAQADALREDQNMDKAAIVEGLALDHLYDEIDSARRARRQNTQWTAKVRA